MTDTHMPRPEFEPATTDYESIVRSSFAQQAVMVTIGAEITDLGPGWIDLQLPWQQPLTQQKGLLHAGVIATVLDSACGYAALSLMPAGSDITTIDFNISLVAPATPGTYQARATVVRRGRTVTFARGEARAASDQSLVASMTATLYRLPPPSTREA